MPDRIYGFAPVEDKRARLLIVGSMPGVQSLKNDFYYAHRQNAFWPIMAHVLSAPVPETVPEKKSLLLSGGIALWDVYASCIRAGSLDSAIRDAEKNDFDSFFRSHPSLRAVLCNGLQAYAAFPKGAPVPVLRLPSTSPAYTMPFAEKLSAWKQAVTQYL